MASNILEKVVEEVIQMDDNYQMKEKLNLFFKDKR